MNKKALTLVMLLVTLFVFTGCITSQTQAETDDTQIIVASSIVPEAGFIETVAGDLVEVVTIIPPGNSPANYQPTTREMQALSDADIYFVMQVPTEEANILPKLFDFNEDIKIVNLREITSTQYPLRHMEEHSHSEDEEHSDDHGEDEDHLDEHGDDEDHNVNEAIDPHIWLSPKRVIIMVQTIADELSELDEDNAQVYQENAAKYIQQLETLDKTIIDIVDSMENKSFMIYHGSYGYFADDYGLEMIAIEADGKSATAAVMQEVIQHAIDEGITSIFYQDEFDDTQAQTISKEIGGSVVRSAPLSKEYIQGLIDFANALSSNGG